MAHFLLDLPGEFGQGPRLMVPRNTASFRIDTSAFSHLTRPAVEPREPVIPGDLVVRTPQDVVKGLGLGSDAERGLEQAVREWCQAENPIAFRSQLYHGLVAFAPRDYSVRNEIARRVQALWKSTARPSRRPGREGLVLQKARGEQLGLLGLDVSVSKPERPAVKPAAVPPAPSAEHMAPYAEGFTVGTGTAGQRLADRAAEREKLRAQPAPSIPKPPAGFTAIPNSKHGGYHKKVGDHYVYWYPHTAVVAGRRVALQAGYPHTEPGETDQPHPEDVQHAYAHQREMDDAAARAAADARNAAIAARNKREAEARAAEVKPAAEPPKRKPWRYGDPIPGEEPKLVVPVAAKAPEWKPGDPELEGAELRAWQEAKARQANAEGPGLGTGAPPGGWKPENFPPPAYMHAANEQARASAHEQAMLREEKRAKENTPEAQQRKLDNAFLTARHGQMSPKKRKERLAELQAAREKEKHAPAEGTAQEPAAGGERAPRLVVPATRGEGRAGEAHGPGEGGPGGAAEVKASIDLLGENLPSPYSEQVDHRPVPEPTPETKKIAITVAEKYLPPIANPLPDQARNFPVPGALINSHGEIVDYIKTLYEHQKEGAERILQAWRERDGFVLQDDAGLGKTLTALAALVAQGGQRNLIVVPTQNKEGLMKQWAGSLGGGVYGLKFKGAKDLFEGKRQSKVNVVEGGLSKTEPGYYIVSYDEMLIPARDANGNVIKKAVKGKEEIQYIPNPLLQGDWDTISFDESHSMVGKDGDVGVRARAAINLADKATKVLYMSATPFTNVCDMHYLTRLGIKGDPDLGRRMFGNSPEEFANWAEFVGAQREGNVVKNPSSWKPKVRIAATLHTGGATLKRQVSLDGMHSHFHQLAQDKLSAEEKQVFDLADKIFEIGAGGMGENIMGMWKTAWSKAYWETLKIPAAVEMAKAALAEGKQVAIFTSYKAFNHAHLRKIPEKLSQIAEKLLGSDKPQAQARGAMLQAAARDAQELVNQLPPATDTVKRLADAFGGPDQVAEIHGATNKKPSDEQKLYQEGRKKVCVATQARGGTGISLHDTTGEAPRVQINLSLPWSGRAFDQVAGRSHRLGSKSDTDVHWMMGDADTERKMAAILAKRLRNQGSNCAGDPDIRTDAGMLAAFNEREGGSTVHSDDEGADIKALEDLTEALQRDDKDKILDDERLEDIRDAFEEYAQQLSAGRSPLAEAWQAHVEQKQHEAELEHARAAEQIRAKKGWHVEAVEHRGQKGYMIPHYPVRLPETHPLYEPKDPDRPWMQSVRSKEIQRRTRREHFDVPEIGGVYVRHPKYTHASFIPQESMTKLAERLGVHKTKIDMRQVMARERAAAKAEEERYAEEQRAKAAAKAALKTAPVEKRAVAALEEEIPNLKAHAYPQETNTGDHFWHITESWPDTGDPKTYTHKEELKRLGARFNNFPMHGGKGWTIPNKSIVEAAEILLGHGEFRKALVVPDMPLDRLLDRTRVQMMMKERSAVGDLIWMAEEVPDELHERITRTPPGWPADVLVKARTHKYLKRTPTGNAARPWRYWYKLPSGEVVSGDDLKAGARFKAEHQGQVGHFEVQRHDATTGMVHVRHDESGQEAHIHQDELKRLVQSHAKQQTAKMAGPPEVEAPRLPERQMNHLGAGGYDEIHGFGKTPEELHRHAAKLNRPDREFATIQQPGGHVLASRPKGGTAAQKEDQEKTAAEWPKTAAPDLTQHAANIESKIKIVRRDPITGEETDITPQQKPAPKPKAEPKAEEPKAEEKKTSLSDSDKLSEAAPEPAERKTTIFMRAGQEEGGKRLKKVPAQFELVEADDLIASHDPESFDPRSAYPTGVQERNYHERKSDRDKVVDFAQNLEPGVLINTTPSAIDGAPIITEHNLVLGGNGRTMGMQRAYKLHPEKAQEMKDYLARHARAFGYTAADVAGMKQPILVRRMQAGDDTHTLSALGRRMNESLTQGMNPRDQEVTLGKHYINQEVMDSLAHHMDPDERLGDFLRSETSKPFVQQLGRSGIIDQFNMGEFVDQDTGLLNEDGRSRVERVLAARIIPDAVLLSRMNQTARESIAKAVPYLAAAEARGWDFRKPLETAVRADAEQRSEDTKQKREGKELSPKAKRARYLAQEEPAAMGGSGLRAKLKGDEAAAAFYEILQEHMGKTKFPAAMKRVALEADRQHHDHGNVKDMFARTVVSPAEAVRHAFGLAGKKGTTAPEEEGQAASAKPAKIRRKKGENDLDYARRVMTSQGASQANAPEGGAPQEASQASQETSQEAPGKGWESARREEPAGEAAPEEGGMQSEEEKRAARDAEWMRQVRQARGEEEEEKPAAAPDTQTMAMFAMPPSPWRKAFEEDEGAAGRYVMHAITWEAKRLVRGAVHAARTDEGVDSKRVIKRLKAFVQEQITEDRDFATAIGAHPVNDATLRGLVQALTHAHSAELAKSLARWSLHDESIAARMTP